MAEVLSAGGVVRGAGWVLGGLCTFRFVPLPWFLFAGESVGPADVMSCFSSVFAILLYFFFRVTSSVFQRSRKHT